MKRYLTILLGLFSLVSVAQANIAETTTTGEYLINSIEFQDNREVPNEVITALMNSKKGEKFSTDNLLNDYNEIMKSGLLEDLVIQPKLFDGGIKLVIQVREKADAGKILNSKGIIPNSEREKIDTSLVVNNVKINGLVHLNRKDLLEKLPSKTGGYFSEKKIIDGQKALLETGLFRAVEYDVVKYKNGVSVEYTVLENPVLNGINIIGNSIFTAEELLKEMKTKPGEVFSVREIGDDRERLLEKYYDNGYVLAEIKDVDINANLELEFLISEGIVRDISYKKMVVKDKGDRRRPTDDILKTKDFVIDRELSIKEDEIFNIKKYDETSTDLMRTGHFKNIKYEANSIPGDPDGKSLVLLIDEEKTASVQGAISYGSEVGLLGQLSINDSNWAGRGQDLGISYEKSNKAYSNFSFDFYDPWIKDTDRLSWGWSLYKNTAESPGSILFANVDRWGGNLSFGKGLSSNVRLSLGSKMEYVTEKGSSGATTDEYRIWSVYPSITYDTRNNMLSATEGSYAKLQVEGGYATGFHGDYFANTTLELRKYHAGFFKKNSMAYRFNAGIMTDTTKESQRFWVGGSSLRGYEGGFFQGTQKATVTIENRTQINDILGLVAFVDAGRAWAQLGRRDVGYTRDAKFGEEIAIAAGVGLRVNTPIGPLRFDFGWPIGKKIGGAEGMQFYFNMGQSF